MSGQGIERRSEAFVKFQKKNVGGGGGRGGGGSECRSEAFVKIQKKKSWGGGCRVRELKGEVKLL